MNPELVEYIKNARKLKTADHDIASMLTASGWPEAQVASALAANLDLPLPPPPPPPPPSPSPAPAPFSARPISVVNNMSTRGFEFIIMFIAMGITASSLGWILHSLADGLFGGGGGIYEAGVAFSSAALLVGLPVFALLFLRLKKAEVNDPEIKQDPSRRRAVQLTLVVTFLIGMIKVITYLYSLFNGDSAASFSSRQINPAVNLVHTIITLVIAGGIFAYYWQDQHNLDK